MSCDRSSTLSLESSLPDRPLTNEVAFCMINFFPPRFQRLTTEHTLLWTDIKLHTLHYYVNCTKGKKEQSVAPLPKKTLIATARNNRVPHSYLKQKNYRRNEKLLERRISNPGAPLLALFAFKKKTLSDIEEEKSLISRIHFFSLLSTQNSSHTALVQLFCLIEKMPYFFPIWN